MARYLVVAAAQKITSQNDKSSDPLRTPFLANLIFITIFLPLSLSSSTTFSLLAFTLLLLPSLVLSRCHSLVIATLSSMTKKKKQQKETEDGVKKTSHGTDQKTRRMSTHKSIFRKMKELPEPLQWEMFGLLEVHFEEWKGKKLISEVTSKD